MKIFCFLLWISHTLYAFHDPELMQLWDSITDMNQPTVKEYQNIEKYLKEGRRAYLDAITDMTRLAQMRRFQLVGPKEEMPICERYSFNVDEKSEQRCILLFASRNGIYPDKARKVLEEISQCGFKGHVLMRIGGFPNTAHGGLKICHVPFAFKASFLKEAQLLGYKEILWIDTAMHPLTNLEAIFFAIRKQGYFFTNVGSLLDNGNTHLPEAAATLGVTPQFYDQIPHISSSIIGLNMENPLSIQLLDEWLTAAEKVYPYMTCWPEELSLSIIAWRLSYKPYSWFGNIVCHEHELHMPIVRQRPLQFYIDSIRDTYL